MLLWRLHLKRRKLKLLLNQQREAPDQTDATSTEATTKLRRNCATSPASDPDWHLADLIQKQGRTGKTEEAHLR